MSARSVVVNAQRRFRARRRRVPTPVAIVLAVLLVLGVGGWLVLNSSLANVRAVTVEGTSRLTTAEVLAAANVPGGAPLFRLDASGIEARVARLRPVASVSVTRQWPHGVLITVVERRPVAVVAGPGPAMLLDAEGVAFAPADPRPAGSPLVDVTVDDPVPGTGDPEARAAMRVLGSLPPSLRQRVSGLQAPSADNVSLELHDGRTIVWGSPDDNATKVAVLRSLLHRSAHVYDVSTPEVVVTR